MDDIIIIIILVSLLAVGVYSSIKHFKGQSGCCGGENNYIYKKKLKKVIAQKTFIVEGMTCENCVARVNNAINDIKGVAARVNLKKKEVVVSMEQETADDVIIAAIERAGYMVKNNS